MAAQQAALLSHSTSTDAPANLTRGHDEHNTASQHSLQAYQKAEVVAGLRQYNPDLGHFQVLVREGDVVTLMEGAAARPSSTGHRKVRVVVDRTGVELKYWKRMLRPLSE